MAKTRQQKQADVQEFTENIKKAKSLVFINFDGLKVKEIEALRKQCQQEQVGYTVTKKTLMKIVFEKAGILGIDPKALQKGVATVLGYDDEVAPARIVQSFAKNHEALKTIGGVLEGSFVPSEKIIALAKLPSRTELLAKVVGSINTPVSGFVNVLAGNLRSALYALNAIKETKS